MKKSVSLILTIVLVIGLLAGCMQQMEEPPVQNMTNSGIEETGNTEITDGSNDSTEPLPTEQQYEKLTDKVFRSSAFSEGLAAVVVGGRNGRGCVINKKGEIVFDLGFEIENSYGVSYSEFINGYMSINGGILDKNGKLTYPEDVGASKFYSVALEGGYIIAEVVEADFSNTKLKLGVMDTNFNWIVAPTEQLYASLSNDRGSLCLDTARYSKDYYYDGYVYVADLKQCLNVETGEIIPYDSVGFTHPSETWSIYGDGTYRDYDENIRLDLSDYDNLITYRCGLFHNGQAILAFKNETANTCFFTVVDEKGTFQFEPVDYGQSNITSIDTDGDTIIVTYSRSASELIIKSYDMMGNLIAEFNTDSIGVYCSYSASISDGVIIIEGEYNYNHYVWYYTTEFKPLF